MALACVALCCKVCMCVSCLGRNGVEGQTYFDELHVQLGVLLHVLKQVSMERLHLSEAQDGCDQSAL